MKGWICLTLLMLIGVISDILFDKVILSTLEYMILSVGSFVCLEINELKSCYRQMKEKSNERFSGVVQKNDADI